MGSDVVKPGGGATAGLPPFGLVAVEVAAPDRGFHEGEEEEEVVEVEAWGA